MSRRSIADNLLDLADVLERGMLSNLHVSIYGPVSMQIPIKLNVDMILDDPNIYINL